MGIRTRARHFMLGRSAVKQHAATLAALVGGAQPPRKLLFLCYGNICRSPVAEALARQSLPHLEIASAGFFEPTGRRTPPHIHDACRDLGLSLPPGSSKRVNADMVRGCDLILLHDLENYQHYKREFPNYLDRMLLLGMFLDPPQPSIKDPYISDPEETLAIMRQIRDAVAGLAAKVSRLSP
jgi:protein-tyrosine phosphatase